MSQQMTISKSLCNLQGTFPQAILKANCLFISKTEIAPAISLHKIMNKIRVNIYNLVIDIESIPLIIKSLLDISEGDDFEYKITGEFDDLNFINRITVRMNIYSDSDADYIVSLFSTLTEKFLTNKRLN